MGSRPDLLLVVGTSLKIPGVKTLVRELSKVIRPPIIFSPPVVASEEQEEEEEEDEYSLPIASGSTATSTSSLSSPKKKRKSSTKSSIKTIYLNFDFPTPSKEWQGIFDAWALGDVQEFVEILAKEKVFVLERAEKKRAEKVAAIERRLIKLAKKDLGSTNVVGIKESSTSTTRKKIGSERSLVGKRVIGSGAKTTTVGKKTKSIAGAGLMRRSRSSTLSLSSTEENTIASRPKRSALGMFTAVDKPGLRRGRSKS